jgi:Fur family peroxide stress response transcriptional regulator
MRGAPKKTMAEFEARCRRQGLPVTIQRRAVLGALAARPDHPTADQLYVDLRSEHPDMSRTTVYRVLDALVALGVVTRVSHPGAAVRYDAITTRHHHLVCTGCGAMTDLAAPALDALPAPKALPHGFEVLGYSVHFHGTCADCRGRARDTTRLPARGTSTRPGQRRPRTKHGSG